jgi:hypothetical protein
MGNRQKQQQAQTQHPDVATQLFNAQQQQALTTQQLQQQVPKCEDFNRKIKHW